MTLIHDRYAVHRSSVLKDLFFLEDTAVDDDRESLLRSVDGSVLYFKGEALAREHALQLCWWQEGIVMTTKQKERPVVKFQTGAVWRSAANELPAIFLAINSKKEVTYLQTDVLKLPQLDFQRAFKHDPKALVVPAARLLLAWAQENGSTDAMISTLNQFLPSKEINMAKKAASPVPQPSPATKPKAASKPVASPKPKASVAAPTASPPASAQPSAVGRDGTVAGFMKRLIMEGQLGKAEILAKAAAKFGFDPEDKKTYPGYYHRQLKLAGANPPALKD